ncbi:hypothetical protein [Paracoccus ravus]|nr:hypothetical protein [Paracoccus ravus]
MLNILAAITVTVLCCWPLARLLVGLSRENRHRREMLEEFMRMSGDGDDV